MGIFSWIDFVLDYEGYLQSECFLSQSELSISERTIHCPTVSLPQIWNEFGHCFIDNNGTQIASVKLYSFVDTIEYKRDFALLSATVTVSQGGKFVT